MAVIGVCRCVVYKNVQPSEFLFNGCESGGNLIQLTDMTGHGMRLAASFIDLVGHQLTVVDLAAGHNHFRTIVSQCCGDSFADTAARASDQCNFSTQIK